MRLDFTRGLVPARSAYDALYPNLWNNLCGAWNPNYGTSATYMRDFGLVRMNMTMANVSLVQTAIGKVLSFNGTTSTAITVLNHPVLTGGARFHRLCGKGAGGDVGVTMTISTWVAPSSASTQCGVVKWGGKSNGSGGYPATLFLNNDVASSGQFSFCMYRAATGVELTQNSPQGLYSADQWCHLVATLRPALPASAIAAVCKLYFNGFPVTVTTTGNWTTTTSVIDTRSASNGEPMMLGAEGAAAPTRRFAGLMGETLIWDRVLSPEEIYLLSQGASPLFRYNTPDVQGAPIRSTRVKMMCIG